MTRLRTVDAPARSDVYFGMVVCSFFAILVAVGLLLLELVGTYGFESNPPAASAPALPSVPARTMAKTDGPTAQAPGEIEKPAVATSEPAPVAIPAPTPPAPLTILPKPPAPAVPAPAAIHSPVPTSSGPVPGFELPKRK